MEWLLWASGAALLVAFGAEEAAVRVGRRHQRTSVKWLVLLAAYAIVWYLIIHLTPLFYTY